MVSAFAPGRVELLGNHTDYNEGLVLGAAIDRGITVSGAVRTDDRLCLDSNSFGHAEIRLTDLEPSEVARWANYFFGVARELIDLGVPVKGADAKVEADLPSRAGLSSSAAFEIATALFLLELSDRELSAMAIAKLCQRAEHRFVGVRSGLMDQVMSQFGRADHLILFDARSEEIQLIPFPAELSLIIADTGKERELTKGEYNARREQTLAAAKSLGIRALRDVNSASLDEADLEPLLKQRARHVVGENERVLRAVEYLGAGDAASFGGLLNQSHESSRENFENSTPELDLLVQLAQKQPGVLGARLTGAGFGGAIVALCQRDRAEAVADTLRKGGSAREVFVCKIADGARLL